MEYILQWGSNFVGIFPWDCSYDNVILKIVLSMWEISLFNLMKILSHGMWWYHMVSNGFLIWYRFTSLNSKGISLFIPLKLWECSYKAVGTDESSLVLPWLYFLPLTLGWYSQVCKGQYWNILFSCASCLQREHTYKEHDRNLPKSSNLVIFCFKLKLLTWSETSCSFSKNAELQKIKFMPQTMAEQL